MRGTYREGRRTQQRRARGELSPDYAGWFLRACVAIAFLKIGWAKFDADPHNEWIGIFERIGFGQWFRFATGVVEMLGAVLYVPTRTRMAGAVLLGGAMVGAIVAHVTVLHDAVLSIVPLALLAAIVGIALRIPDPPLE